MRDSYAASMENSRAGYDDLIRINFVAPFATNVVLNPAVLLREGIAKTQKDVAEALQVQCPSLLRELLVDGTNKTLFPVVFLEAELGKDALQALEAEYPNFYATLTSENTWAEDYVIEINKARISIYDYGFGNLSIEATLSVPKAAGIEKLVWLEDLEQLYDGIFSFIGDYNAHLKDDIDACSSEGVTKFRQHPAISQFKPAIDQLREAFQHVSEKFPSGVRRSIANPFEEPCGDMSEKMGNDHRHGKWILEYDDFLWEHHVYLLPWAESPILETIPETNHRQAAKEAANRLVEGTYVDGLRNELCYVAHISHGSSYMLIERREFEARPVEDALVGVIETAGVFYAAVMELTYSLDIISDLYSDGTKEWYTEITFEDFRKHKLRISHIRSMMNQYERSLPAMPKRIFEAVKKEWSFQDRLDYLDWKMNIWHDV